MYFENIKRDIEALWENINNLDVTEEVVKTVKSAWHLLDDGEFSVVEKMGDGYHVNDWLKKAILLGFKAFDLEHDHALMSYDRVPLKFAKWRKAEFDEARFRVVPGAIVRFSAHIEEGAIIMPSFINVGARIGAGTLVDAWATVGSCASIGRNCHISGGAGIGGVLEPLQANPVILEDDVFIGARSEVAEGVIIGRGSVLSMGVYIGASTRIYNRETKEVLHGKVPPYSVVVPGTLPSSDGLTQTYAAIIVKSVDDKTRAKTAINDILRDVK